MFLAISLDVKLSFDNSNSQPVSAKSHFLNHAQNKVRVSVGDNT